MAYSVTEFDVHDATLRALNWRNLRHVDWLMPLLVLALAALGWAHPLQRQPHLQYGGYFQKQVLFFVVGIAVTLVLVCLDYRFLVSLAPLFYGVILAMLVAVLFAGEQRKGSERWLALGPFGIQPSEFSKLAVIYMLTWYFTALGPRIRKLHWFLIAFVIAGVPAVLILKQPNLGTAATLGPITVVMLFLAGCRMRHMAVVALACLSVVPLRPGSK